MNYVSECYRWALNLCTLQVHDQNVENMKVQISNCKAKIEISARLIARACCSCQQYMFLQSEGMVLHRRLAQFFFNAIHTVFLHIL